jgi:hypothetical protein
LPEIAFEREHAGRMDDRRERGQTIERSGGPYLIADHRIKQLESQSCSDAGWDKRCVATALSREGTWRSALKRAKTQKGKLVTVLQYKWNQEKASSFEVPAMDFVEKCRRMSK